MPRPNQLFPTLVSVSACALMAGCALHGEPPPASGPDWQNPQRQPVPSSSPSSFGADLRLSEFQGAADDSHAHAQAPMPQGPRGSEPVPWNNYPYQRQQAEPDFRIAEDPWGPSGADSGIQPSVYGVPPQARGPSQRAFPEPAQPADGWVMQASRTAGPPVAVAGGSGLGAGDVVRVTVFGQPDLETSTVVSEAGSITLPLVGSIQVGGLSTQQAEQSIASAYRSGGFLIDPQITLAVQELRSRQISVLGQVQQPGRFPLSSRMTLLDALALAGGVSQTGGSTIYLIRDVAGQTRKFEIDVDNMLAAPDTRTLLELGAGDTIYVPEAPLFYIYGEVRRPDGYALKPGMTVMQAISVGGGLTDRGSDSRLRIRRRDSDGGTFTVRPSLEDRVREGDVIYVKERLF